MEFNLTSKRRIPSAYRGPRGRCVTASLVSSRAWPLWLASLRPPESTWARVCVCLFCSFLRGQQMSSSLCKIIFMCLKVITNPPPQLSLLKVNVPTFSIFMHKITLSNLFIILMAHLWASVLFSPVTLKLWNPEQNTVSWGYVQSVRKCSTFLLPWEDWPSSGLQVPLDSPGLSKSVLGALVVQVPSTQHFK